jgi:hypothetical protein
VREALDSEAQSEASSDSNFNCPHRAIGPVARQPWEKGRVPDCRGWSGVGGGCGGCRAASGSDCQWATLPTQPGPASRARAGPERDVSDPSSLRPGPPAGRPPGLPAQARADSEPGAAELSCRAGTSEPDPEAVLAPGQVRARGGRGPDGSLQVLTTESAGPAVCGPPTRRRRGRETGPPGRRDPSQPPARGPQRQPVRPDGPLGPRPASTRGAAAPAQAAGRSDS